MQKWEYKLVRTYWHHTSEDETVMAVDGVPLVDPSLKLQQRKEAEENNPSIEAYSQQLGEDGWELVGIRLTGRLQSNARYVFKRPKS